MKLEKILQLDERVVTFGAKSFPSKGHFIVMAGGPGVGKNFVLKNIVMIDGKVFDHDDVGETLVNKDIEIKIPDKGYSPEKGKYRTVKYTKGRISQSQWEDPDFLKAYYKDVIKPLSNKKSKMFFQLMAKGKTANTNIIVNSSGRSIEDKILPLFPMLKAQGFQTTLIYVHANEDVAWKRNLARTRTVARDVFDEIRSDVEPAVKAHQDKFDHVWYIDSSLGYPNSKPGYRWWEEKPETVLKVK